MAPSRLDQMHLGPEYSEHSVFSELEQYCEFYDQLAYSVFPFLSQGMQAIFNTDSYAFSSMSGTLESIGLVLGAGRINDAFALLRKYHDSVVINIYSKLYIIHNHSLDAYIVAHINDWVRGKTKLPRFESMIKYVINSNEVRHLSALLDHSRTGPYMSIRNRCNDHTHYNFYQYVLLNDNQLAIERLGWLDQLSKDVLDLFVFHLAYVFSLSGHYLIASDYVDALELGMSPEPGSEYWVAPYVQAVFDDIIKPARPDVAAVVRSGTEMDLR